ncbi:MAG TPA: LamG-like jellyroll fold domain-containing protein [Phycisphaerae bacterium]|nr:LamG-like jellyroll fold domain-containing protein [Phycisphaerae bacterium]
MTDGARVLVGMWLLCVAAVPLHGQSMPAERQAADLTGPWQLFVDDHLIAVRAQVARKYHAFEKHEGNPVLAGDQPWEGNNIYLYGTILPGEDGKGYRMWYQTIPRGDEKTSVLYATSADGVRWDKPNLGIHERKGSKDNNVTLAGGFMPAVIFRPWEIDAERRYLMMTLAKGGWQATVSRDGLHWKELPNNPVCKGGGDSAQFFWDPQTKQYVCFGKVIYHVDGSRRRCVGRSATKDLTNWPPFELVLTPDTLDDRWADGVRRTHLYGMSVFAYETMYIGLLWIFRATDDEGYLVGPVYVELATSRDGVRWERPGADRTPVLALGKPGAWDDGQLYTPTHPLVEGDRIRLFYSGFDEEHGRAMHGKIGLATLRKDGFASLDAGDREGTVLTKRLAGAGGGLHVNCAAAKGWLKVEVLDGDGKVLPGYELSACEPVTGDGVDQAVTWGRRKELPAETASVRLRFVMRNASLYSFKAGESVRVLEEASGPVPAALYTFEDDWGRKATDKLVEDGAQEVTFLGGAKVDDDPRNAAFGQHAMRFGSEFTPLSTMEIEGTAGLGRQFTLAASVRMAGTGHFRLFSSFDNCGPVRTADLVFDADPAGKVVPGLRLICKGVATASKPVTFMDGKYHHLAAVYDDGVVRLYLDGNEAGCGRVPGGNPVELRRNLFLAGDAALGTIGQFDGHVDDVLVFGRALSDKEIEALARKGAAAFFRPVEEKADKP